MQTHQLSLAVLISSCDSYSDIWQPFFRLFFRYWQDCPFQIYLITNNITFQDARVKNIATGEDKNWASNMRHALNQISESHIIYMQEDYFLNKKVDTSRILKLFSLMISHNAGCMRLYPSPGPDLPCEGEQEVGEISQEAPYRVCLQSAIWDKQVFESLLVDGENAWQMEGQGTIRSRKLTIPFLSVKRDSKTNRVEDPPLPYYCTAVVRGRWVKEAIDICIREGIAINTAGRPIETYWQAKWRESNMQLRLTKILAPLVWFKHQLNWK